MKPTKQIHKRKSKTCKRYFGFFSLGTLNFGHRQNCLCDDKNQ